MIRQIDKADRAWVLAQHKAIYITQHGFDDSFGELVAEILDRFLSRHDPRFERGWIAEQNGRPLGSIFCTRNDDERAQLRLFFLIEEARGIGLGRRMIAELIGFARTVGYSEIHLWTHQSHAAACAIYRATGWRCTEARPTVSFGREETIETYVYSL